MPAKKKKVVKEKLVKESMGAQAEVPEGTLRLECVEGKSRKFWQIRLDDNKYEITFGKIGTAGQTQKKKLEDEWAVKWERDRLLGEKMRKGYSYVYTGKQPKVPAKPAQNTQLEAQIAKDPANDDNFAVYADWLHRYGCDASIKDVAPILDAKGLGKLKHLGLKNCQFGNEIIAALPKSKILKQLETLDLSMSHITTDVLKREVLPHKAAFAHLKSLDLHDCRLDKEGEKLARQLTKNVNVRDQDQPRNWEEYRYAAVGE